tara:strand:- start:1681 stop:2508 length:828 start_codon:yes stop_codon:yes gene_type:complete
MCNWVKYAGPRYFHQGVQGKSDGTLIINEEIKMEVECKVVDCSKRNEEDALKSLFQPAFRTYGYLNRYRTDETPILRVLVIGIHKEDKTEAWRKIDPSIYKIIVVAYKGENFSDVDKVVRHYETFDDFAEDLWDASCDQEYFDNLQGSTLVKRHLGIYQLGHFEILQFRIFKRLTEIYPKWIHERLALDAFIQEQVRVGLSNPIENKKKILEEHGLTTSRNLTDHFEGKEWIVNNGEKGSKKKYFVQIKKIIHDIWDGGHKAKTESFINKYGLPS